VVTIQAYQVGNLGSFPDNGTKNLIGPQAHDGIIPNQGQSHRELVKLLGHIPSR